MYVTSRDYLELKFSKIPTKSFDGIDLPVPDGPLISSLCQPAASKIKVLLAES